MKVPWKQVRIVRKRDAGLSRTHEARSGGKIIVIVRKPKKARRKRKTQ